MKCKSINEHLHRVIQSFSTILGEVVWEMIWSRKGDKLFIFAIVSKLRRYFAKVSFIFVNVEFYKIVTSF
jgi:hypothetical protein